MTTSLKVISFSLVVLTKLAYLDSRSAYCQFLCWNIFEKVIHNLFIDSKSIKADTRSSRWKTNTALLKKVLITCHTEIVDEISTELTAVSRKCSKYLCELFAAAVLLHKRVDVLNLSIDGGFP
jgi:hypothetical protein